MNVSARHPALADEALRLPQTEPSPFGRWHLQSKYQGMEKLFRAYLKPRGKFLDMACGKGEALLLARRCVPDAALWGLDIDGKSLEAARRKVSEAILQQGDMHDPQGLPTGYFDVVHEFGAAFLSRDWAILAKNYMSLLCEGGVLLWELPQRWSMAHISYLLRRAPERTAADTKMKRILRTLSPSKYRFESDRKVSEALEKTGFEFEILERIPLAYLFCRGLTTYLLDWGWKFYGDELFERLDRTAAHRWGRCSSYYLVVQKGAARRHGAVLR